VPEAEATALELRVTAGYTAFITATAAMTPAMVSSMVVIALSMTNSPEFERARQLPWVHWLLLGWDAPTNLHFNQ
jgi:hypothetical protein